MEQETSVGKAWRHALESRQDIFLIFRNLRWIILLSLVITIILYLPDQVRELYRISASDGGLTSIKQFIAIGAIALFIWFGAFQIATETSGELDGEAAMPRLLLQLLPIVLGLLPVAAAAVAQIYSRPSLKVPVGTDLSILRQVGSIFRIQEEMLNSDKLILWVCFAILVAIVIALAFAWWWFGERFRELSNEMNGRYFVQPRFMLLTFFLIVLLTMAFVGLPDSLAQFFGSFGILMLFTLCVVMFSIHASLLTISHRMPYFPLIFAAAVLIAATNINDNHHIRTIASAKEQLRISAKDAFTQWLQQPDRSKEIASSKVYPVFIVSAQGGGLYAAYNAATFLARIEDLCPAFRQHLFAISSVSGGSLGAAVFAAGLHTTDPPGPTAPNPAVSGSSTSAPCAKISAFLARASKVSSLSDPGHTETYVQKVLSNDFLSPLVAGTLFPDFAQSFIPFPVGAFDRARTFEYTLENAVEKMDVPAKAGGRQINLMKEDYQSLWAPDNGMPALLMNTTDAGSGKRVLISPFDVDGSDPQDSDLCILANIDRKALQSKSLHFRLSTAAFMSARFPWVSPAATVDIHNDCITQNESARLVDGGYMDNSGVETALDLIEALKSGVDPALLKNVQIYHIALAGGDFPDHGAFSFGELMEPIRALLSTRTSRAYIALNRAALLAARFSNASTPPAQSKAGISTFARIDLQNYFYDLPLGWDLSDKTRDIISLNSGRFWDCQPDGQLSQSVPYLSKADCVLIQVYNLLNGSADEALKEQAATVDTESYLASVIHQDKNAVPRFGHEKLLACYERDWLKKSNASASAVRKQYLANYQTEQVRALLNEWDGQKEANQRVLAYLLGSISYDSEDFARATDNLSFRTADQIPAPWRKQIDAIHVDIGTLLNQPELLANVVWGSPNNIWGNREVDDGWNYRTRGIYEKIGREQYTWVNEALPKQYPNLKLDVLKRPNVLWDKNVSAKVAFSHFFQYGYSVPNVGGTKTLVQLLDAGPGDWMTIRALQQDVDHKEGDQKLVAQRSDVFLNCIHEANEPTSRTMSSESLLETTGTIGKWFIGSN